jgi:hypothetical protein
MADRPLRHHGLAGAGVAPLDRTPVVVVVLAGFPIALILAWAFDDAAALNSPDTAAIVCRFPAGEKLIPLAFSDFWSRQEPGISIPGRRAQAREIDRGAALR